MCFTRSEDSERAFISALQRPHNTKHAMFTAHLIPSLNTLVPSRIRESFDVELFPMLDVFGHFDTTGFVRDSTANTCAARLVAMLSSIGHLQSDLLSGQHGHK